VNSTVIDIRTLRRDELEFIRQIDRTERLRGVYHADGSHLIREDVVWDTPNWSDEFPDHNHGLIISDTVRALDLGGTAFGAFDADVLVGLAVYRPRLGPEMAQLVELHVSCGSRRQKIASRLFEQVLNQAKVDGATQIYVSATPSASAMGFYVRNGFLPTGTPDSELLAKEPDDIHMVRRI
jgi:ribosomal protein S18 acetylase RimI-like enzyme